MDLLEEDNNRRTEDKGRFTIISSGVGIATAIGRAGCGRGHVPVIMMEGSTCSR